MSKSVKHAIFDFDGTIADSSPGIFNAISYVTQCMGLNSISDKQKRKHIGPTIDSAYRDSFKIDGNRLKEATVLHKEYMYDKGYKELTFYPEIETTLASLKDDGVIISIATLKSDDVIKRICKEFDFLTKVDIIHGYDADPQTNKTKLVGKCVLESEINPELTVMVGDTEHDLQAATIMNIGFIGVAYGFGNWNENAYGAVVKGIARGAREIYEIIGTLDK